MSAVAWAVGEAMIVCERCGTEGVDGFRFCGACGALLTEAAPPRETRKIVTALFCDVVGSTALGEEIDPEALRGVMNRYFEEMRATIERHGGTVEKFIGDAVMAVFGIPVVHEDDALRAVRAASEIRERLPALAEEVGVALRFRTGINTGSVLTGQGEALAIGDAVNVAARLEQTAAEGEIVVGAETLRLVRDAVEVEPLEPLALKGKSEPVPAFRLLRVDPAAPGSARRMDTPFVARERELRALRDGWSRAVEESGCHLFTLLGAAGVGKSRLVSELLAGVGEGATVLRGRCLYYGEGITFWPLVEALAAVGEAGQTVLAHLTSGGAATPDELFWEVRRLIESLAAERPLILHVDDLQWAEPMLLDLLDHVADLSRGAPILLLCTARPELLEERPSWGGGKFNATTVLLEPLGSSACEALLEMLGDDLDGEARARVVAASQGNPLFLEEMAALAREGDSVTVPPTIQALLAARLERLGADERELLERGAVEGEVFHRLALRALAGERLAAEVEPGLAGLVRKELIRPHAAMIGHDDAFRFRHLLIRDAAYDRLPKAVRAELHERFADWLEEFAVELLELDEIAGWHLEQAVRYRRELGRAVDPALTQRAAARLEAGGRRARERSDDAAARGLLERALALAGEADTLPARIGLELADLLIEAGEFAPADALLNAAEHDPATAVLAALSRLEWLMRVRPDEGVQMIQAQLPDLLEQLAKEGDERGLAKAHLVAFLPHWLDTRATPAAEQVLLAAEHARKAGDEGLRSRALGEYVMALILGRDDAATITRELDLLTSEEPGPYLAAFIDLARSELERMVGHFDEARSLVERATATFEALGSRTFAGGCAQSMAWICFSAGDPAGAVVALERADAALAALGERSFRSTTHAMLARAYELSGDHAAARAAVDLAESLGAAEDRVNFVITHTVRACLALTDRDEQAAERWARSAIDYALLSDFILIQAQAKLTLADVLAALGRRDEAATEAREALTLYESKGDQPSAAQARAALEALGMLTRPEAPSRRTADAG
jgi:class 3 adenylate cyclase